MNGWKCLVCGGVVAAGALHACPKAAPMKMPAFNLNAAPKAASDTVCLAYVMKFLDEQGFTAERIKRAVDAWWAMKAKDADGVGGTDGVDSSRGGEG